MIMINEGGASHSYFIVHKYQNLILAQARPSEREHTTGRKLKGSKWPSEYLQGCSWLV